MRRLLNFCLLLVLLGSVGYLLHKAKLLPFGGTSSADPTPTAAPAPVRENLRISVAHRPEILLVSALKRLLEAENLKIEVVPFNPETSWMELAAGELDVVIAPIGEAVTAQARFDAGRFLFFSGVSQGYDVIMANAAIDGSPKTLAVAGGQGGELFAIGKFPDSRLVPAASQQELQSWLMEGAVQAAVLESASLRDELAQSGKKLGATSPQGPMPTVVVLSRGLLEENASTTPRIEVLLRALDSWNGLIGYLSSQPELLRSTLKPDAGEMGVDLDVLLRDYQFLTPDAGRAALVESCDQGLLKQTLDLLVLARTGNLTAPGDWATVLELPDYLASALPGGETVGQLPATPAVTATPGAAASPEVSPTGVETPAPTDSAGAMPTHTYAGAAPPESWPEPRKMPKVRQALDFPPALLGEVTAAATARGLEAWDDNGKPAFKLTEGGAPLAPPLADESAFYVLQAGTLRALDVKGKTLWAFPFEGTPGEQIVLTPESVVFTLDGNAGYEVLAVSKKSNQVVWRRPLASAAASPPVYAYGGQPLVIVLDEQGNASAWNAQSGGPVWQTSIGKPTFLPPASGGDEMAVLDPDGAVRLLSLADGTPTWEIDLGTPLAGTPTLTEGLVLVPAKDTYLYALDRGDGAIKQKRRLSVPLSSAPIVVGERVYCCDELGGVHSLSLPDLGLDWSKSLAKSLLRGPVFTPDYWALLSSDGTLLLYDR